MLATETAQTCVADKPTSSLPSDLLVEQFRSQIAGRIADLSCREIVLDFQHFPRISSRLINELIGTHLELRLHDRSLRLVNVQPEVCNVFKLLRLDRTLDFSEVSQCSESKHVSPVLAHRVDDAEKNSAFFLRRFAVRTLALLRHP
jgi:anti-anti-sigma regulatory factor